VTAAGEDLLRQTRSVLGRGAARARPGAQER
jgi:hypothetical protein